MSSGQEPAGLLQSPAWPAVRGHAGLTGAFCGAWSRGTLSQLRASLPPPHCHIDPATATAKDSTAVPLVPLVPAFPLPICSPSPRFCHPRNVLGTRIPRYLWRLAFFSRSITSFRAAVSAGAVPSRGRGVCGTGSRLRPLGPCAVGGSCARGSCTRERAGICTKVSFRVSGITVPGLRVPGCAVSVVSVLRESPADSQAGWATPAGVRTGTLSTLQGHGVLRN